MSEILAPLIKNWSKDMPTEPGTYVAVPMDFRAQSFAEVILIKESSVPFEGLLYTIDGDKWRKLIPGQFSKFLKFSGL